MSATDKPDVARAWLYAETLLAQDEAERVEKLSDAGLDEELRAAGLAREPVPTTADLLARIEARAAGKIAVVSATEQVSRVVPMPRARRPARLVWAVAAMVGLVGLAWVAANGPAIVAFFKGEKGEPIRPDDSRQAPPTPREVAEKMRDEAEGACQEGRWALCRTKLDEAKRLDPGGESEPRVQQARAEIEKGLHPDRRAPLK